LARSREPTVFTSSLTSSRGVPGTTAARQSRQRGARRGEGRKQRD
jgi:hypothetical protein